jgi:hypothetical protein
MDDSRRGSSGAAGMGILATCVMLFPLLKELSVCTPTTCCPCVSKPLPVSHVELQPTSVYTGHLLGLATCATSNERSEQPQLIPEPPVLIRTNHLGVDGTCKSRHLGSSICESVSEGSTVVETGKGGCMNVPTPE